MKLVLVEGAVVSPFLIGYLDMMLDCDWSNMYSFLGGTYWDKLDLMSTSVAFLTWPSTWPNFVTLH